MHVACLGEFTRAVEYRQLRPTCFVGKPKPIQVLSMLIKSRVDRNRVTRAETRVWRIEKREGTGRSRRRKKWKSKARPVDEEVRGGEEKEEKEVEEEKQEEEKKEEEEEKRGWVYLAHPH
uniref:Uncharacterized protein n=1 Tax=Vespula pensylvanica TaxID=30213 RepID=A0A834PGR1_VESPE|nr:hypothetical protein H0235_001723 [Vespula pensylvanica]